MQPLISCPIQCKMQSRLPRSCCTWAQVEEQWIRDLLYLCAVAKYKLRQFLAAREQLVEILKVSPESRQAQSLKTAVDDKIVQEVRCLSSNTPVPTALRLDGLCMMTTRPSLPCETAGPPTDVCTAHAGPGGRRHRCCSDGRSGSHSGWHLGLTAIAIRDDRRNGQTQHAALRHTLARSIRKQLSCCVN